MPHKPPVATLSPVPPGRSSQPRPHRRIRHPTATATTGPPRRARRTTRRLSAKPSRGRASACWRCWAGTAEAAPAIRRCQIAAAAAAAAAAPAAPAAAAAPYAAAAPSAAAAAAGAAAQVVGKTGRPPQRECVQPRPASRPGQSCPSASACPARETFAQLAEEVLLLSPAPPVRAPPSSTTPPLQPGRPRIPRARGEEMPHWVC
mmetsp:Transcript_69379/g.225285  ORF Transcript_69379/g.225285 Transcript_69379/m.225285 type:complete len:204 (-) Transcript_69379:697-1308(-)